MTNFAQKIRDLAAQRATNDESPFVPLLKDFAQGLCEEGRAVAKLEQGADHRRYRLVLHPKHRPAQQHLILSFWVEAQSITVSGEQSTRLDTTDALGSWLESFVTMPAFQESLAELAQCAKEPVEAYLRTIGPNVLSRDDVMVEVAADDQRRLDEAADKREELQLVVHTSTAPGAGKFSSTHRYVALDAAGLSFSLLKIDQTDAGAVELHLRPID